MTEIILEYETVIRDKGLEPDLLFPEKAVYICANKEMLSRVFSNLISNILKYTKDEFVVAIIQEDSCVIKIGNKVSDSDQIDVNHIFDRTYRADSARTEGGAGLGLYIAKLLVEKQKGKMEARLENGMVMFYIVF